MGGFYYVDSAYNLLYQKSYLLKSINNSSLHFIVSWHQLWFSSDSVSSPSSRRLSLTAVPGFWEPVVSVLDLHPAGDSLGWPKFCAFLFSHIYFPFLCLAIVWPDCTRSWFTRNKRMCLSGRESYVGNVTAYFVCMIFPSEMDTCSSHSPTVNPLPASHPGLGCFCTALQLLSKPTLSQHWAEKAGRYWSLTLRLSRS